jgi:hypothetical protein
MSTTNASKREQAATSPGEPSLDIEAKFPADPDLMVSPEGDLRGLKKLQDKARARRADLARP